MDTIKIENMDINIDTNTEDKLAQLINETCDEDTQDTKDTGDLVFTISNPFGAVVTYSFNPNSKPGEADYNKSTAIVDSLKSGITKEKVKLGMVSERELDKLVIDAFCQQYPNPNLMKDKIKAFPEFTGSLLYALNFFHNEMNKVAGKKLYKPIKDLTTQHVEYVIMAYYDLINFVAIPSKPELGVVMCQSKDEELDPLGKMVSLRSVLDTFVANLGVDASKTKKDTSFFNMMFNVTTEVHHTGTSEETVKYYRDVIPCANGIYIRELFNKHGRLISYREARKDYNLYVPFSMRSNYLGENNPVPELSDPERGTFNPEECFQQIIGDGERYDQFLAVVLAVGKPNDTRTYKQAIFFMDNGQGNTGKSTLLDAIVELVGREHVVDSTIEQLEKEYLPPALAELVTMLILGHENDPKGFKAKLDNFKVLCTGDPILVNSKYNQPVSVRFKGRMLQGINGTVVKSKDDTDSTIRRYYPMMFRCRFDDGDGNGQIPENKDIKDFWIKQQEVVDWLLTEAINRNIDSLPITEEMLAMRDVMAEGNNPILRFRRRVVDNLRQNHFVIEDLYPLYVMFCRTEGHSECALVKFEAEMNKVLRRKDSPWDYSADDKNPDKFKLKRFDQYHVPLKYIREREAGYITLKPLSESKNALDSLGNQAKNAISALYDNVEPGVKRNNAYFKKPQYEAETLISIAKDITGVCHNTGTAKEAIEKLREYKYYTMEFKDGDTFGVDPVIKIHELDGKRPGNEFFEIALWDMVVNRLAKLETTVDIDAIIAHMDSEFEVDDEDKLEKIGA